MLNIYAHSFMTATRTGCVKLRSAPKTGEKAPKRRWLPLGHWWLETPRCKRPDEI